MLSLLQTAADLALLQIIFVGLYLCTFAVVAAIYRKAAPRSFHPILLAWLCLSKRIHSIFCLRLFNDGPTMLLLYVAILLFLHRRWTFGCIFFSLAFSIKMNIILFAPALGVILLLELGFWGTVGYIVMCGLIQIALAAPFLAVDPMAYVQAAFNVTRVFKRYWSVNFKWVPCTQLPVEQETLLVDCEGPFSSAWFGMLMKVLFVSTLLIFANCRWCAWEKGGGKKGKGLIMLLKDVLTQRDTNKAGSAVLSAQQMVLMFFTSNVLGIIFARSLHFQFYIWYFHTLPFLLWSTPYPALVNFLLLLGIEVAWNPWTGETSTEESSMLLTGCHALLLVGLWMGAAPEHGGVAAKKAK
jgi:alpha-1,3-mannosyltransferase